MITKPLELTTFSRYKFLGVRADDVPVDRLLDTIMFALAGNHRVRVLNVNASLLILARSRPWLKRLFDDAELVFVDGVGAKIAGRILVGAHLTRSTPPDWINQLGARMAAQSNTVFWLGSTEDIIQRAAKNFYINTGVRAAGCHHGFFDQTASSSSNLEVIDQINGSAADLLILNMGMPLQEQWLATNWPLLNVKVALTAGALAEWVADATGRSRPPAWVGEYGLEWATRLIAEPRKVWKRYIFGLPQLAGMILFELLKRSFRRKIS